MPYVLQWILLARQGKMFNYNGNIECLSIFINSAILNIEPLYKLEYMHHFSMSNLPTVLDCKKNQVSATTETQLNLVTLGFSQNYA